ncbi:hypothetical protein [Streptantibioticus ferralitis]|uniref:Uncharacterized protein n=1 Tax=Streptantibioticus ferralitis TaxID=236510 RepID=A0ABT5Z315_9ACTN|nr:hypothetical protein [Streptantibioticus ferralitis]MDF2257430.1 hypothetical protein [Streptantibioticus ferralitis]
MRNKLAKIAVVIAGVASLSGLAAASAQAAPADRVVGYYPTDDACIAAGFAQFGNQFHCDNMTLDGSWELTVNS